MTNTRLLVEESYRSKVEEILINSGFEELVRMPRQCLYDYEAKKDGKVVYVDVKTRSVGYAPVFTFRESKWRRLKELKELSGREIYILLIQGTNYRLFEIDDIPKDLKPFTILIPKAKVISLRFPIIGELTDEEKNKIIELRKQGLSIAEISRMTGRSEPSIRKCIPLELRRFKGGRHRYLKSKTTIAVDKETLEILKKLRKNKGEPVGIVVERIIKEYLTKKEKIVGY